MEQQRIMIISKCVRRNSAREREGETSVQVAGCAEPQHKPERAALPHPRVIPLSRGVGTDTALSGGA